ncbi:unnamed protein product [Paramecium octaurelia]|uniref:WD40-repeat-containing domain n=1 Tax=Paramecium octaurelia TaxID=43137 RepID=A0A8S1VWW4_PAROT|nr:unnamed protein product [Paramecium octaurelia]
MWTQEDLDQLLNCIACFNDDIKSVDNCNFLKNVSDQLIHLINLSKLITQVQLQQIQLVSIGVGINKYTNRSIEGIFHFPLIDSDDLYQLIKDLFEKKSQQILEATNFEFEVDNKRFPSELQLQPFESSAQNKNVCLNRYFNYVQNDDQNQQNDDQNQYNENSQNQQYQIFIPELLVEDAIVKVDNCSAIAINKNCSIVVAGYHNIIKIFKLKQEMLIETQNLKTHQGEIVVLNFMNQSNQFISGSKDNQIIIWSINNNHEWIFQSKLVGHNDKITCLVLNNNEDLIVSGSNDQTIKFWTKNIQCECQQTIEEHNSGVRHLSINQQQNKVISCGKDNNIFIIECSKQNSQWIIIQRITEVCHRLCFIDNDLFALIKNFGEALDIYENNHFNKQFEWKQSIRSFNLWLMILFFQTIPIIIFRFQRPACNQETGCFIIFQKQQRWQV